MTSTLLWVVILILCNVMDWWIGEEIDTNEEELDSNERLQHT